MEFYQEPEENRLQSVISWIVDIVVVIALASYLVYCFGSRVQVTGNSMSPVLNSGDVILMNRLMYDLGNPDRFDVVVFSTAENEEELNIRRIIGLPGETVQIKDNQVYIDGLPLDAELSLQSASIAGAAEYPMELSDDEYFVLGDNRESSEDSRFAGIGTIRREQMVGKVWLRFQPFDQLTLIR